MGKRDIIENDPLTILVRIKDLLSLAFPVLVLLTSACQTTEGNQGQGIRSSTGKAMVAGPAHSFDVAYLTGHFDPALHPDFVVIDTIHSDRPGLYLRKEPYAAFLKMQAAAKKEGIQFVIRSATRNFAYQKGIWERKWTGETRIENGKDASKTYPDPVERARMILKYSSMPGTSRHHWGTDIDINSFENSWFETGEGLKLYTWMSRHAAEYGFCQPYSQKGPERPSGYEEEKWHWSYLPVANALTRLAKDSLNDKMISGFLGSEAAPALNVVDNYVLGISKACLSEH